MHFAEAECSEGTSREVPFLFIKFLKIVRFANAILQHSLEWRLIIGHFLIRIALVGLTKKQ